MRDTDRRRRAFRLAVLVAGASMGAIVASVSSIAQPAPTPTAPAPVPPAPTSPPRAPTASVARIDLTVADLEARAAFFIDALGATRGITATAASSPQLGSLLALPNVSARTTTLRLGNETLGLRQLERARGRAIRRDAASRDLDFQHVAIVVADIDVAWRRVIAAPGIRRISPAPQRIPDDNPAAGGIRAAYFRDAEGHPLELIWYPNGRGDPRWQRRTRASAIVLGIDHTAIAARSTDASRRFYVELLGLQVAGTSLNSGVEQQRLSGVRGARVAITAMRGTSGPGVELLEYQAPGPGRASASSGAADLAHTETVIAVADLDATIARLREANVPMLAGAPSPCIDSVCVNARSRAIVVRDPDGHAVRLEGR